MQFSLYGLELGHEVGPVLHERVNVMVKPLGVWLRAHGQP
jgi:hypothetical protein